MLSFCKALSTFAEMCYESKLALHFHNMLFFLLRLVHLVGPTSLVLDVLNKLIFSPVVFHHSNIPLYNAYSQSYIWTVWEFL